MTGSRTRATRVTSKYSTTEPPMYNAIVRRDQASVKYGSQHCVPNEQRPGAYPQDMPTTLA